MAEIEHRTVQSNGINMRIAEAGTGPLVLLCHGFPESWYSWRHQLPALAAAGYHAVAPDMRGYGETDKPPAWLSEDDLAYYTTEFERTGFRGGLNWYRNFDRNWELLAPWAGVHVKIPALFIGGLRDKVVTGPDSNEPGPLVTALPAFCDDLRGTILIEGAGHWNQQEAPRDTNRALLDFLDQLARGTVPQEGNA